MLASILAGLKSVTVSFLVKIAEKISAFFLAMIGKELRRRQNESEAREDADTIKRISAELDELDSLVIEAAKLGDQVEVGRLSGLIKEREQELRDASARISIMP